MLKLYKKKPFFRQKEKQVNRWILLSNKACSSIRPSELNRKSYQSLFDSVTSELLPYYPETFQLDTDYHQWFHECIPHLPIIPRTLVEDVVKPLYHKLTSEEQIRNTFEEDFCITTYLIQT